MYEVCVCVCVSVLACLYAAVGVRACFVAEDRTGSGSVGPEVYPLDCVVKWAVAMMNVDYCVPYGKPSYIPLDILTKARSG